MSTLKKVKNDQNVHAQLETITPDMAAKFLSKNINNRVLDSKTVRYYEDMILRNKWMVNGETIKVADDDTLLDGQHRMEAVVRTGIPVQMFVVYGVDKSAFMTIDAGRPRRHGDYLKVNGKKGNLPALAAAARVAMSFNRDGEFKPIGKVSPDQLVWYVDTHEALENAVESTFSRVQKLCSGSIASGLKYIFSVVDESDAEAFFDSLVTGANLPEGSPVLALRTRLTNLRGGGGGSWNREVIHCFVTAFNAYRDGRSVTYLKYLDGSKTVLDSFKGQLSDSSFIGG